MSIPPAGAAEPAGAARTGRTVPPWLAGLVDDAAIFPPGNAAVPAAVAAHDEHRAARYADLVGPFLVSDARLPELVDVLAARAANEEHDPLPVRVVVSGGAGAIEPAVTWVRREPGLLLAGVEVAARDDAGSPGGLAHNITRILTCLSALGEPVAAHVELPRLHGPQPGSEWLRGLDVLATADVAAKLRTGGESADAHPSEAELAASIDALLDRELAFKATAGLHHAVRHTSPEGWEQHGFLNLAVATATLFDGGSQATAVEVLADRDPEPLVEQVAAWGVEAAPSARRWFTSFGCCRVLDPVDDLVGLGLLDPPEPAAP